MPSELTPHRGLTPAACSDLVQALRQAEATFETWGVRIPPQAALHEAREWLAELGQREVLQLTVSELKRTSKAAALAVDLYHISTTLGEEPNSLVATELANIVRGAPTSTSSVQDFIAQFWVGTLLAQSHLHPRIDARDATHIKRPDFLAEWGTLDFVVEVKCPKSVKGAVRAISSAANQLREKVQPGVIFVDATYALGIDPTALSDRNNTARDQFAKANSELHTNLQSHIENYSRSDKFSRIVVLLTFARFWSWITGPSAQRDAGLVFNSTVFPKACQGLVTQQAEGFQNSLLKGIEILTGNAPSVQRS